MKNVEIQTSDQLTITGHHFKPDGANEKVILINPRTGIIGSFNKIIDK